MTRQIDPASQQRLLALLRDPNRTQLARRVASAINRITANPRDPGFRYRDFRAADGERYRLHIVTGDGEEWVVIWKGDAEAEFHAVGPSTA